MRGAREHAGGTRPFHLKILTLVQDNNSDSEESWAYLEIGDTQPTPSVMPAADAGTSEGGGQVLGIATSTSRASPVGRTRPKHPYGRRNTYIGTYTRHGLGYCTVGRDETLTKTKFRDLSSRERRLYTLTLGYGLREDGKSAKRQRKPEMSRGHAVALMARLQEMMLHEGRTVEGIFAALGLHTRCCACTFVPLPYCVLWIVPFGSFKAFVVHDERHLRAVFNVLLSRVLPCCCCSAILLFMVNTALGTNL